ncbi:MAG: FecR domain-containing protein, partial [Bacteroidota bacterium]
VIELKGEAFFQVAHDMMRPFIAITENIETRVLGTSFNIKARSDLPEIAVTLVEGKVKVNDRAKDTSDTLIPGEYLTYDKLDSTMTKTTFQGNLLYGWKEDVIDFQDATISEVVKVLSEKYNTEFEIIREEEFESTLVTPLDVKKYALTEALDIITKVTDIQFKKNKDGSITVSPK